MRESTETLRRKILIMDAPGYSNPQLRSQLDHDLFNVECVCILSPLVSETLRETRLGPWPAPSQCRVPPSSRRSPFAIHVRAYCAGGGPAGATVLCSRGELQAIHRYPMQVIYSVQSLQSILVLRRGTARAVRFLLWTALCEP